MREKEKSNRYSYDAIKERADEAGESVNRMIEILLEEALE